MFKATDVLFSEDGISGKAYKPVDNMVIFSPEGVKTLGKSIWKVIDDKGDEFALIFHGVKELKNEDFEITFKGNLYDNSENKSPREDYTPLLTIIGKSQVCEGCTVSISSNIPSQPRI